MVTGASGMQVHWVFWVTAAVAGLVVGSFLNVVAWRGAALWRLIDDVAPDSRGDLVAPRSYCLSCKSPLGWIDLIPVLGYLVRRGRCRRCGARIGAHYPLVELAGAGAAVLSLAAFGPTFDALFASAALFLLLAIAEVDRQTTYIPDALSQPLLWLGLLANIGDRFAPLPDAVIGGAAGYLSFAAVALAYRALRGREGLGEGDAVLLAAIGAWTGWALLPFVVLAAAVGALALTLLAMLRKRSFTPETEIPFGPALAAAGAAALLLSRAAPI